MYCQVLSLLDRLAGDTYRQALSALVFTATTNIAWRDFLCHQAPRALVFTELQTLPSAPLLTARHHRDSEPPISTWSLDGSMATARRYISTCAVLVLVQVQTHFTLVALICSHSRAPLIKSIAIYNVPDLIAPHMCIHPLVI